MCILLLSSQFYVSENWPRSHSQQMRNQVLTQWSNSRGFAGKHASLLLILGQILCLPSFSKFNSPLHREVSIKMFKVKV